MILIETLENITLALLLGAGVYLSAGCRFFQLLHFPHVLRRTLGDALFPRRGRGAKRKAGQARERRRGGKAGPGAKAEGLTPFQALTTALAGSVGTGNIAGVAGAILIGGPGAVFWMFFGSLFGMATKFCEVALAVRHRQRGPHGGYVGGPMYYIRAALPGWLAPLSGAFCFFGMFAAMGIGNMTQVNTVTMSVVEAVGMMCGGQLAGGEMFAVRLATGVLLAAATAAVIVGGVSRIGSVTEKLIPFVSAAFIVLCVAVLAHNWKNVLPAAAGIVRHAFTGFEPIAGGAVGIGVSQAARMGLLRGMFSNEAGLGSAPMAHASAMTDHPARQGLYGIMEVWIDTTVICTLTGLTLLASDVAIPYGDANIPGAVLVTRAVATVFGEPLSSLFMAVALLLFGTAAVIGWSYYGQRCAVHLLGEGAGPAYQWVFIAVAVAGALLDVDLVWRASDFLNSMMTLPNLAAVLLLSGSVFRLLEGYKKRLM